MKTILASRLPTDESNFRASFQSYKQALTDHALTEGIPAPLPAYEVFQSLLPDFIVVDDSTADEKELTLPEAKEELRKKVNQRRNDYETGGFPYLDKIIDSDERSFFRIATANDAALKATSAGQPFAITWRAADNSPLEMDGPQMLGMLPALAAYGQIIFDKSLELKAQIEAAESLEDLADVDINGDWLSP